MRERDEAPAGSRDLVWVVGGPPVVERGAESDQDLGLRCGYPRLRLEKRTGVDRLSRSATGVGGWSANSPRDVRKRGELTGTTERCFRRSAAV
jgi:hypothetical protein